MPRTLSARALLALALLAGLVLRVAIVFTDDGIVWPDEIYQSFEPAHRLVFGHGLVAWEFAQGARNWALPGFVAFWLKLSALFGGDSPLVYVRLVKCVFALMSVGAALGAYRLATVLGARELDSVVAATIASLSSLALYFGHRAMSETACALPIVWGLALLLERGAPRWRVLLGASLLGLATMLRLHAAVVCVAALTILVGRALLEMRSATPTTWRRVAEVVGVLAIWAVAFGALDALTWRHAPNVTYAGWFHSAIVYLRFNLIEGKAAGWGTAPWSYYLVHLYSSMPFLSLVLAVGTLLAARRAPGLVLMTLGFIGLHMLIAHKELRFILPVLPVGCALVGVGLSLLPQRADWILVALLLLLVGHSAATRRKLTMGDIGSYPQRAKASAWDDFGDVNRLLFAASRRSDLCGVRIDVAHLAWTGGSTYLHRPAPIYSRGTPLSRHTFNYVIGYRGGPGEVVARQKGLVLKRLRGVACEFDERYRWRLP
ncbi:MAG: hypothetical protein KC609_14680 [Myxococcales bacterium]|nr:hypothetical protein [Myxococcales bacterium]